MADTMRKTAFAAPRALLALVLALTMCPMPGYADEAEASAAQDGAAAAAAPNGGRFCAWRTFCIRARRGR